MFYELLAGLDPVEREQLSLQESESYYYLNQVGARPTAGPAQGGLSVQGCEEEAEGSKALPPTTAVLHRARPAGSRARRTPRTSQGW